MTFLIVVVISYAVCAYLSIAVLRSSPVTLPDGTVETYPDSIGWFCGIFGLFGPLIAAMYVAQRMPDGTLKVVALDATRHNQRRG